MTTRRVLPHVGILIDLVGFSDRDAMPAPPPPARSHVILFVVSPFCIAYRVLEANVSYLVYMRGVPR